MKSNQVTLTGEKAEQEASQKSADAKEKKAVKQKPQSSTIEGELAPPEQRGGDDCCPWCLAAAETFNHHDDGSVGCSHCDAAIPTDAEWYQRGEKIVV